MNNHLKEQLLGYLLDALDDEERRQIEKRLDDNPELIDELKKLQISLLPLRDDFTDFEPPAGLAERACSRVEQRRQQEPVDLAAGARSGLMPGAFASASSRISVADVVVTAGIVLAAVLIFFPAIASSRYASRLTHCQNNLRHLGIALVNYSDKLGGGFFPAVASSGNRAFAGVYAPTLLDAGYLNDASTLICPSSSLADLRPGFRVPTLSEIDHASPQAIILIRQHAGGSYGYTLGVIAQGAHVAPRNRGRSHFGLMADVQSLSSTNDGSTNHAGQGRNILFEDGHFRFVQFRTENDSWVDNPFRNRFGMVEAGVDEEDAVIAPSGTPPFSRNVSLRLDL